MEQKATNDQCVLNCICFNARSLCNKLCCLHDILSGKKYFTYNNIFHIIAVCETWLNNDFADSMLLNNSPYIIFRKDRPVLKKGGGVCLFVKTSLAVTNVVIPDKFFNVEIIAIDVKIGITNHRIVCVYKPPACNVQYVQDMCDCLAYLGNKNIPITICGDLNFPNIDWRSDTVSACIIDNIFQDFVINYNLTQCIHEATSAINNNILDLLLVSHPVYTLNVNTDIPFETSDHCSVSFSIWGHANSESNANGNMHISKRYNFAKTDYNGLIVIT